MPTRLVAAAAVFVSCDFSALAASAAGLKRGLAGMAHVDFDLQS